jgi:hypothetical protein
MDRIPTLQPSGQARMRRPTRGTFRAAVKRIWAKIRRSLVTSPEVASSFPEHSFRLSINPATGLPMVGGVDTAGSPYGSGSRGLFGERHPLQAPQESELIDIPPFHADCHEPRITMDSIERRWDW